MVWRANKYEVNGEGQFAVRLKHISGRQFWFDLWFTEDHDYGYPIRDITGDWNQYIFHLTDSEDMTRKKMQENSNNYMNVMECAIDYLMAKGVIERCWVDEHMGYNYIQHIFA